MPLKKTIKKFTIDDINTLNDRVFEDQIKQIYPTVITCNWENPMDIAGHFLEVDITVKITSL